MEDLLCHETIDDIILEDDLLIIWNLFTEWCLEEDYLMF